MSVTDATGVIRWRWWLSVCASLKLTLLLLGVLGFGVTVWHFTDTHWRNWLIALPLLLLALNLLVALLVNKNFRVQPWLLLFHLALLALLLIAALGQMTLLLGEVEVTTGEAYDSGIAQWRQGRWHDNRLARLRFELQDFTINYLPEGGMAQRHDTHARLRWFDDHGALRSGVVGDKVPLVLEGYRFYTTHNKGFAPGFVWHPHGGEPLRGSIHLPSWPTRELAQSIEWEIPDGGRQMWSQLQFDEVILDPQAPSQFRAPREHVLVMRFDDQRHELRPGDSLELPEGRLVYQELRTWMGFRIFYDWTLPWLLAAGLVAVIGLGGHYWKKFHARPWLDESEN